MSLIEGQGLGVRPGGGQHGLVWRGAALLDVPGQVAGARVYLGQLDPLRAEPEPPGAAHAWNRRVRGFGGRVEQRFVGSGGAVEVLDEEDQTGDAGDTQFVIGGGASWNAEITGGDVLDHE